MRRSVRAGFAAVALASVALVGCGSSGGSDASGGGSDGGTDGSSTKGCELVSIDDVKAAFPDEGIDKEASATVEGSSDACEFTGDVKAGVMGKYTGPTTVTLVVGTYDEDDFGQEQYDAVAGEVGADVQESDGLQIAAGEQKAVAKFQDGSFAFATIDSPELSGPGNEQTVAMVELLAGQ